MVPFYSFKSMERLNIQSSNRIPKYDTYDIQMINNVKYYDFLGHFIFCNYAF